MVKEMKTEYHPGMLLFKSQTAGRKLEPGDCVRMFDQSVHFVQYVNSSGAYVVPLSSASREIAPGYMIEFTRGGRTISANAIVEAINPKLLGVHSSEYTRYVKMYRALIEEQSMAKRVKKRGTPEGQPEPESNAVVTLDAFDSTPVEFDPAEGLTDRDIESASVIPTTKPITKKEKDMAKKAAKAAAPKKSAAKKDKAPKQVRKCACACGGETTGYFCPGHDARMHGWINKLSDGRIDPKDIPAAVRAKLELIQTKNGFKAGKPHFWKDAE